MVLGRFAPHLISTQRMQARKFQAGLQPWIHSQVACLRIKNYQELVNVAAIVEAEQRGLAIQINTEWKRTSLYATEENLEMKKMSTGPDKGKSIEIGSSVLTTCPICGMCGKNHGGKCKLTLGLYFRCGQPDHLIRNCPKRGRRNGTVPIGDSKPKPRPPVLA